MKYCSHCGAANKDNASFCNDCGTRFTGQYDVACPYCGTANPVGKVFCSNCGLRLPETPKPQSQPPPPTLTANAETKTSAATEPPASKEESIDDWLAQLRANPPEPELTPREQEPHAEPPAEEKSAPASETPPFVSEETRATEETPAPSDSTQPSEELPAWLQTLENPTLLESEPNAEVNVNPTTDFNADAQEIERLWAAPPDESDAPQANVEAEIPRAEISDTGEALPDWLAGAAPSTGAESFDQLLVPSELREPPTESAPSTDSTPEKSKPGATDAEGEAALPSWLKDVSAEPSESESVFETTETDWVSRVGSSLDEEPTLTDVGKLGVADWLSETAATGDEFGVEPTQPNVIEPGQVPEWVQALRPAEAAPIIPPLPQEAPPTTGFLAGLRGVLPLAPLAALPKVETLKPSAEAPADGAAVFASILSTPAQLVEGIHADEAAKRAFRFRERLAIYFLVLVAILVPLLLPPATAADIADVMGVGVARPTSAEFFEATRALQPNATVVMAFDYDAGQAGELDPAARAVMSDLLSRNIHIVAFSTTRTGPALAQALFDQLARANKAYVYGTNFVNLGFLPGEGTGLRSLAQNGFPTFATDFNNTPLAKLPALAPVRGWQDIALTIEIAGNGDPTLKNWVEQFVQPVYGTNPNPRVAIVSAQAEPQALVYRNAKQLTGVLAGLVGGAEYEFLLNQPGRATAEVDAQSFAHLALVLLIVVGNVAYVIGRARKGN